MKKILIVVWLILVSFVIGGLSVSKSAAQTPTPIISDPVCYSQCASYRFYWMGDFCWDVLQANCSQGKGGTALWVVKFLYGIADAALGAPGGLDVSAPLKATFYCAPIVEQCIVPKLQLCNYMCKQDPTFYAPDLTVTSSWLGRNYPGLRYDDTKKTLTADVMNDGMGHAMNIDVDVTWGSTKNRDKIVSGGGSLIHGIIPELRFKSARQNGSDTPQQNIANWIISQSNLANYFPPDPTINEIPFYWEKTIPFSAPDNEFTKVTINVDPSNLIKEGTEDNNTYTLEIDKLPTPHKFTIENFKLERNTDSLTAFTATYDLKNTGQELGDADIKWYDQKYTSGLTSFASDHKTIPGQSQLTLTQDISVDVSLGSASCATSKKMAVTIADSDGVQVVYEFSVPLYAGSVNGVVKDLLGKPIAGATITAASGQSTTSDDQGNYRLKGINQLGIIKITASHPNYSQIAEQEVEFSLNIKDPKFGCETEGLTHDLDFTLKNQDVVFTVTVKDNFGVPHNAHVLVYNSTFRQEYVVNGTSTLPGLQPGEYTFIIFSDSGNFKTTSQTVNAVPTNQNLEFVIDKLPGRQGDFTLNSITPVLLWDKTLGSGEKTIGNLIGTKDGNLLVASVGDNKSKTRNLFFLDLTTGQQKAAIPVPYSVERQRFIGLDAAYDGGTVGLFVNPGTSINKQDSILKLFDATGHEIGSTTMDQQLAIALHVSPDGFYICPHLLLDKGLHKYTRYETEGKGDDDFRRNPAVCDDYFLRNNHLITTCSGKLCEKTISNQLVRTLGDIHGQPELIDSTYDSRRIVVRTADNLYYSSFQQENPFTWVNWNKQLKSDPNYQSVAISPEGTYILVTEGDGSDTSLKLKLYSDTGEDKTPNFPYKDVRFVFANDRGMFFASIVSNRIKLFQIGKYLNEYHPDTVSLTSSPVSVSGISYLGWADQFTSMAETSFKDLTAGTIYRADQNIQLAIIPQFYGGSLGTLSISKDTLFSVDYDHNPVLLKGQMVANFGSPATIYAIKFNHFELRTFKLKLDDFIHHRLAESEYFVIKNIHTKFTVKNDPDRIQVAVDSGEVQVTGDQVNKKITSNKQISIYANNKIIESLYVSTGIYSVVAVILILLVGILLFIKRNTPVGKFIISIFWQLIHILKMVLTAVVRMIELLFKKVIKKE